MQEHDDLASLAEAGLFQYLVADPTGDDVGFRVEPAVVHFAVPEASLPTSSPCDSKSIGISGSAVGPHSRTESAMK